MIEQKTYYRRHLPHWHPPGAVYHIVFRLAGSLPREVIEEMRLEREREARKLNDATRDAAEKSYEKLLHGVPQRRHRETQRKDLLSGESEASQWNSVSSLWNSLCPIFLARHFSAALLWSKSN